MKTCRKSVAAVLLLSLHLLTLQIDDAVAGRDASDVKRDPRVILEEVIITGSGNDTRVTANAVAEEPSKIGDEIIALLSKRNARRRRWKQASSDLDADQSRAATVNAEEEDEDLETLKRVIAKYEPQRITSRKTKRKIVDGSNGTHDVTVGSSTDLEKIYHDVLRNISRRAPELMVPNTDATLIPYLSQVVKDLGQTRVPAATIRPPASDDGAAKSRSNVDASPSAKNKKKSIFKKYLQMNRTAASPRISESVEEDDRKTADSNESDTAKDYFKALGGKTKNASSELLSNAFSDSAKKPESSRKWNVQESPALIAPPFNALLNNGNAYNIFNAKNSNVPSDANSLRSLSKYDIAPRPFSILQSPGAPVATNLNILYRKPSPSPAGFNQQQLVRSSANVLPLVLPTELFSSPPPARYYIPIKRTNHVSVGESAAAIVSTEASPAPANAFDKPSADYSASYADVIGTTQSPLAAVNGLRSSGLSGYYAVTENPAEIPSQTSASYALQRQKHPQIGNKNEFPSKIATYDNPEKPDLNANLELALYNKFANLYSVDRPNVFNMPKAIAQNYQDFRQPATLQQVPTLPYAPLKPISPTLLNVQPAKPALAPYYESRFLASQDGKELNNKDKDNGKSVETNEQSRVENANEAEGEAADDRDNFTNYKTRINHGASKIRETPDEQRARDEKDDRAETERKDYHTRDHENQDKYYKNKKNDKNNDGREKYENIRHENNKDEEDVDETHEDEYVSAGENEDEHDHDYRHPYNKYEYDRDDSEEQRENKSGKKDNKSDEQSYEKRDKENDNRDKHDYKADFGLESGNKYSHSRYNDDETREDREYSKFYDNNKKSDDNRREKNRQDRKHEDSEEEDVAEDKLYARRSKDRVYGQREKNEKDKGDDTAYRRKYRPQTIPRKDSRPEEYKHEEYSETNPEHVHKEYHNQQRQQHVKNNQRRGHRKYDSESQDDNNEKPRDHVHGETKEHAHKHEEHHEKKKDGGNHKFEEGEGAEHEEEHHGQEGEEGKKGYKVWHENEKAEKGHHDKEHASKEYDEKHGEKKKHGEEGGYHAEHHHDEEGEKTAEFGEKGEHKKGHSTHGEHSVHKKDEFEKKTEFFDEFHEDDGEEKHGEHHHAHESKKGGHEKKAHHDAADHEAKYGKESKHEEGGHHHEEKGHKADEGHDHHHDRHQQHGKKEGHEHGKKWSYEDGDGGGDHKHNR